jgi:indolepyruvate ferredoxin oxidoreductase beta subunit
MKTDVDIVIAGVGGQGNLLLSRMLGQAALRAGIRVQTSESYGASQRGGAVFSHVRLGQSHSPVIPLGHADVLLGLEPSEALRQSRFLARDGHAIVNTRAIMPVEVLSGKATYPSIVTIRSLMKKLTANVFMIDAVALAEKVGDVRTANTAMLGSLDGCDLLPFEAGLLRETIPSSVPSRMIEANLRAFDLGKEAALGQRNT